MFHPVEYGIGDENQSRNRALVTVVSDMEIERERVRLMASFARILIKETTSHQFVVPQQKQSASWRTETVKQAYTGHKQYSVQSYLLNTADWQQSNSFLVSFRRYSRSDLSHINETVWKNTPKVFSTLKE